MQDYIRYRPRYPRELVPLLRAEIGLTAEWLIADVGSGTGFSAELFLENGNRVIGIEPNPEMRVAAERLLERCSNFSSLAATAEETGLAESSIDLILCGQSFHWFQPDQTRAEFERILRPGGWSVLVWNRLQNDSTPFLAAYESLLKRYGTDYRHVRHERLDKAAVNQFFGQPVEQRVLFNEQLLDFDGLKGRLLSSSYTPPAGDPARTPMLAELAQLFAAHEQNGRVHLLYHTDVFFGRFH